MKDGGADREIDDSLLIPIETLQSCPPVYTINHSFFISEHDFDSMTPLSLDLIYIIESIRDHLDVGRDNSVEVLADAVDPDAVDGIFRPILYRTDREEGFVQFPLDEFEVRVYANGRIMVDAETGFETACSPEI